jgi:hypothetical protein
MELNEALDTLKDAGATLSEGAGLEGKVIPLSEFNRYMAGMAPGWKIIEGESNKMARVFTVGKEGIGKFKFSVLLPYGEKDGNFQLDCQVRFLGATSEDDAWGRIDSIVRRIFG